MTNHSHSFSEEPQPRDGAALLSAGGYVRRSSKKHQGLDEQMAVNRARAIADGYQVRREFEWYDDHTSGRTTQRKGLTDLLEKIRSGHCGFKRLYVRDEDRLARLEDTRFHEWFEYEAKLHGVQVCYATAERHLEDVPSSDRLAHRVMTSLKRGMAHMELVKTHERTSRGLRNRAKDGYFVNQRPPYGFERWIVDMRTDALVQAVRRGEAVRMPDHAYVLQPMARELEAVVRMYDAILEGKAYLAIARELEHAGYPPPGGIRWGKHSIARIVTNPLYKGEYTFGRTMEGVEVVDAQDSKREEFLDRPVAIRHAHYLEDPPVSVDKWERVCSEVERRRGTVNKARSANPSFLLTRLLHCRTCGCALFGHRQAERGGVRAMGYRHSQRLKPGEAPCPHQNRYLPATPLESAVLALVLERLAGGEMRKAAVRELEKQRQSSHGLRHQEAVQEAERLIKRLTDEAKEAAQNAAHAGSERAKQFHRQTVDEKSVAIEQTERNLQHLVTRARLVEASRERLEHSDEGLADLKARFLNADDETRKRIVASIVEGIDVDIATAEVTIRVGYSADSGLQFSRDGQVA